MRILNVGPFLLPVRLSLPDLMAGDRDTASAAFHNEFAEFDSLAQPTSAGLLLDVHRSTGARLMETMLFEGVRDVPGLGPTMLYLSSLAVGFVVVGIDLPEGTVADLEQSGRRKLFKSHENPVTDAVNTLIAEWSRRAVAAVPAGLHQARPDVAMPAGQLLWWHRVSIDPPAGVEFPAARWYGAVAELAHGTRVSVGDGFTNIHGPTADRHAHDVLTGLMVATQEWIIVDEAKRLLASNLLALTGRQQTDLVSVDTQYLELLQLTEEVTLRQLLIDEELRYLANARIRTREAAIRAWRMAEEVTELEGRISALRDLFNLHRERITNDRDNRRNRYVFVLTLVTLIQSILIWYDFLTNDNATVGADPRPSIAVVVLVLTVISLVGALFWGPVVERRQRRRRRPKAG